MNPRQAPRMPSPRSQRGVSLLITMVLILGVLILAVMSTSGNIVTERASANSRDADMAFQAAETALRVGEAFAATLGGASDGSSDCLSGAASVCYLGVGPPTDTGRITTANWTGLTVSQAAHCPSGSYTCAASYSIMDPVAPASTCAITAPSAAHPATQVPCGTVVGVYQQPTYLIEVLPAIVSGEEAQKVVWMYRVTAKGWGASPGTQKVLQSVYYPIFAG